MVTIFKIFCRLKIENMIKYEKCFNIKELNYTFITLNNISFIRCIL